MIKSRKWIHFLLEIEGYCYIDKNIQNKLTNFKDYYYYLNCKIFVSMLLIFQWTFIESGFQ